jgi:hypothetical protein
VHNEENNMQGFKKLALVAAIAAVPAASFAMQPMNDSQMSGVTGQDGITLSINTPNLTLGQTIYDRDGIGATAANGMDANSAGAIVITGMAVNTNGGDIVVNVDAGQAAGAPVLNVGVTLPNNIQISTGDLSIANTTTTRGDWTITNQTSTILDSSTITLGTTTLNIQLGNVAQSMSFNSNTYNPMILVSTTITGGIVQTNTGIHDLSTAKLGGDNADASIFVDRTTIKDADDADLTVGSVGINVATNGLVIGIADIGSANGLFIGSEAVRLGGSSAAAIGDVAITGLQLSGTSITVSGH